MRRLLSIALLPFCSLLIATAAQAEPYVGFSAGESFSHRVDNIKGNENTNFPNAPTAGSPLLTGAHYTDLHLDDSATVGVKAGYYFDNSPFGIEGEFFYSRPNFKRQDVTITHPGFAPLGVTSITEDQQSANANLYVIALNGMYRYKGWKDITPYAGAGPALYMWDIHGTGLSGIIPSLGFTGAEGPKVDQHPVTIGTNVKVGMEYDIGEQWGMGTEYRYSWSPFRIDEFRSVSDGEGTYQGHAISLTLVRHF